MGNMLIRSLLVAVMAAGLSAAISQPTGVDTSKIGPQVGEVVPAFEGIDQDGNRRSLSSVFGTRGAMLVFFRSSDW